MDNWQAGDLALCVKHDRRGDVRKGNVYTVIEVTVGTEGRCAGVTGLYLAEAVATGTSEGWFAAFGFRKVTPDEADAFDREVIEQMTGMPATQKEQSNV